MSNTTKLLAGVEQKTLEGIYIYFITWGKVCAFWFLYHCVTLETIVATDDQNLT